MVCSYKTIRRIIDDSIGLTGPGPQWLGPFFVVRLIRRTPSSVMTPIDQRSTTGPNIILHKAAMSELPSN